MNKKNQIATIYIVLNPLGAISTSYSDEKLAQKEVDRLFKVFGESYKIEPCPLQMNEEFKKRVDLLFMKKRSKKWIMLKMETIFWYKAGWLVI